MNIITLDPLLPFGRHPKKETEYNWSRCYTQYAVCVAYCSPQCQCTSATDNQSLVFLDNEPFMQT